MSSDVVIRSYQPSDQAACESLFTDGHLSYGHPQFYITSVVEKDMQNIEEVYIKHPKSHWWIAVSTEDNSPIGQVALMPLSTGDPSYYRHAPEDERDYICELHRMTVSANAQRNGVGSKLISTLFEFAREKGYRQVHLTTLTSMDKACGFYEKNGFIKGPIDRYVLNENLTFQSIKNIEDFIVNKSTVTRFQLNEIIPDEDLHLMKLSPNKSNRMYAQHYLFNL